MAEARTRRRRLRHRELVWMIEARDKEGPQEVGSIRAEGRSYESPGRVLTVVRLLEKTRPLLLRCPGAGGSVARKEFMYLGAESVRVRDPDLSSLRVPRNSRALRSGLSGERLSFYYPLCRRTLELRASMSSSGKRDCSMAGSRCPDEESQTVGAKRESE